MTIIKAELVMENQPAPPVPRWFRERLAKLGGRNEYGGPNLRIVWGQDETRFAFGEQRMKYLMAVVHLKRGVRADLETGLLLPVIEKIDIGKPRFFIEEWRAPELFDREAWERKAEIFGPFPTRGQYRHILTLEQMINGKPAYRAPDREAMGWIEEQWHARLQERLTYGTREEVPDHVTEQAERERLYQAKLREQQKQQLIRDMIRSSLAPHIHRLMTPHPNEGRGY